MAWGVDNHHTSLNQGTIKNKWGWLDIWVTKLILWTCYWGSAWLTTSVINDKFGTDGIVQDMHKNLGKLAHLSSENFVVILQFVQLLWDQHQQGDCVPHSQNREVENIQGSPVEQLKTFLCAKLSLVIWF